MNKIANVTCSQSGIFLICPQAYSSLAPLPKKNPPLTQAQTQTAAHKTSAAFRTPMHSHPKKNDLATFFNFTTAQVNVVPALFLLAKSEGKIKKGGELVKVVLF